MSGLPKPTAPTSPPCWFRSIASLSEPILPTSVSLPCAADCAFAEISRVAASCCPTAQAMFEVTSLMSRTALPISRTASTALRVEVWISVTFWPISVVALAVCSASALTSCATTAKPRPASPARAASMVALSASRLVCSAMVWIKASTPSMRWVAAARLSISLIDLSVRWPVCSTTVADCRTWRLISSTEADNSSVAPATALTLWEACSVAPAATTACPLASDATWAMDCAVLRIDEALSVTARTTSSMAPWKASTDRSICRVRASRASDSCQHLRIEVAVAVHRFLEDLDRARQRADLVGARGMRNLDIVGAVGDLLDGRGDDRERPRDRAGDDQDADHDHDQRDNRRGRSGAAPVGGWCRCRAPIACRVRHRPWTALRDPC